MINTPWYPNLLHDSFFLLEVFSQPESTLLDQTEFFSTSSSHSVYRVQVPFLSSVAFWMCEDYFEDPIFEDPIAPLFRLTSPDPSNIKLSKAHHPHCPLHFFHHFTSFLSKARTKHHTPVEGLGITSWVFLYIPSDILLCKCNTLT